MSRTESQKIVFQNQSHLIQRHFDKCEICPSLIDICLGTDLMVRYATEGYSSELAERFQKFEIYLKEQYPKL